MKRIFVIIALVVVLASIEDSQAGLPSSCPKILSKADWGGRAAKTVEYTIIPVKYVIIHHTVTPNCDDEITCADLITNIQNYHMDNLDFHDIGYNFVIGGDGNVYEGAGWHRVGAHTRGYNSKSIGIGFVGTFTSDLPKDKQLEVAKKFLQCAVDKGELEERYKLLGARTVSSTQSPGLRLFKELKTWKGFTLQA